MSSFVRYRVRLAAVLLAAFLAACSILTDPNQANGAHGAPEVGFVTVTPQAVPLSVTLAGRTVAYETSEVRPQVSGLIRKRYFTQGSYVRAGQPLFLIDPSLYDAAVNQAEANLASAKATADAAVAKANRYRPLAEMEAIAKQDYTDAVAQARVARAAVDQNAAALDTAKINLRFTTVPAPISGRIGRSLATVGALASASQENPLAIIQRIDPIYVDIQQSVADITALRRKLAQGGIASTSTEVHLKLEDGSEYGRAGTVEFSEATVNEDTGTVTLRARFSNPDGFLLPGMFVNAVFDQAIDPNAMLVPQPAVLHDFDGSAYVFLVGKDNKAQRRKIVTDRTYGQSWVVTKGLAKGDRVILQGLNGLKNGAKIRPVPASTPQKPGPPAGRSASGKS